jgi:hypothetical protein
MSSSLYLSPSLRPSLRPLAAAFLLLLAGCGTTVTRQDNQSTSTAGGGAGADRSCLPECFVGHQCCKGSCDGPALSLPNDCCECLEGEVSSAECASGECGAQ